MKPDLVQRSHIPSRKQTAEPTKKMLSMTQMLLSLALLTVILTLTGAQNSPLPSCKKACRKLRGQCNVSLTDLANTACFDTRTNTERTCDCGIRILRKLADLPAGSTVRDCVIPTRLSNSNSEITINARFVNVHAVGFFNTGALTQNGDIRRSTICDFECVGRNRFQNCVIASNVIRSTFDVLSAQGEATLAITGPSFSRNKAEFIRSDADIQIGCTEGFADNTVNILTQPNFGRFTIVLGTRIVGNRFETMAVGAVSNFAEVDGNTAGIATAEGPCNVIGVQTPILVDQFLAIPNSDRECAELFRRV